MARLMLSDEFWSKLTIIQHENGIYHKPGLRMMVEGMLSDTSSCPWRDLPPEFGSWNTIFQKFKERNLCCLQQSQGRWGNHAIHPFGCRSAMVSRRRNQEQKIISVACGASC